MNLRKWRTRNLQTKSGGRTADWQEFQKQKTKQTNCTELQEGLIQDNFPEPKAMTM